jgi:Zn-dependent M28 family amino/carboxypeptidase
MTARLRAPVLLAVVALCAVLAAPVAAGEANAGQSSAYDPVIASMIGAIDEQALYQTTYDLQNFTTRVYGKEGNRRAATYIVDRLGEIPGVVVTSPIDRYGSIVATLPGTNATAGGIVVVGAHYDSASSDPNRAPGATDDGCGVATVLELARVMSGHRYEKTIVFAFWNAEETGLHGSEAYARNASLAHREILAYLNYDAGNYDPEGELVVDITHDQASRPLAEAMSAANAAYGLGLTLTFNLNPGPSDYNSFRDYGFPALDPYIPGDYEEYHTPADTVDVVSLPWAKKVTQLGLALLADTAELSDVITIPGGVGVPRDLDGDGTYEDANGNGRTDFADVTLYFNRMTWIAANEPLTAFDYNANGRIDFADVTWLFNHL